MPSQAVTVQCYSSNIYKQLKRTNCQGFPHPLSPVFHLDSDNPPVLQAAVARAEDGSEPECRLGEGG